MEYCIENIELLLVEKFKEALNEIGSKEIKIIDIGVYPWHSKIEVSFYFTSDTVSIDDIASWPSYDYSKMDEGQWESAKDLAKGMNNIWENELEGIPFLMDFATAVNSDKVSSIIEQFNRSKDFKIQILDPDNNDSENYCIQL